MRKRGLRLIYAGKGYELTGGWAIVRRHKAKSYSLMGPDVWGDVHTGAYVCRVGEAWALYEMPPDPPFAPPSKEPRESEGRFFDTENEARDVTIYDVSDIYAEHADHSDEFEEDTLTLYFAQHGQMISDTQSDILFVDRPELTIWTTRRQASALARAINKIFKHPSS